LPPSESSSPAEAAAEPAAEEAAMEEAAMEEAAMEEEAAAGAAVRPRPQPERAAAVVSSAERLRA
jgi:hypothetical protein